MIIWIFFYYIMPALICTAITLAGWYIGRKRDRIIIFVVICLALSWTPVIVTQSHGIGIAQVLLALLFYKSGWISRTPIWEIILAFFISFSLFWHFIFTKKQKEK
jgi:hypothetical protein